MNSAVFASPIVRHEDHFPMGQPMNLDEIPLPEAPQRLRAFGVRRNRFLDNQENTKPAPYQTEQHISTIPRQSHRLPLQEIHLSDRSRSAKRNFAKTIRKREAKFPFSASAYLAISNAGAPVPEASINNFIRVHFPGCITADNDSWKKPVKETLEKNQHLFVKLDSQFKMVNAPKNPCLWTIRDSSRDAFLEILTKYSSKGRGEHNMGMANPGDWRAIFEGNKSLPAVEEQMEHEENWMEDVESFWSGEDKTSSTGM